MGVSEGGWHAAEGLILARYFMFTQVYFHKTRVAFGHHLQHAMAEILPGKQFPSPKTEKDLEAYLRYDDWRILGEISQGKGGEHGPRILNRKHFREIRHTLETPDSRELAEFSQYKDALGDLLAAEEHADKSWYKIGLTDIPVIKGTKPEPLSKRSSIVNTISKNPIRKIRLYVRQKDRDAAEKILKKGGD